jgi:tape measure domain-containing protein
MGKMTMSVEVDSVIVDLEARIDSYRKNMLEAVGIYRGLRTEMEKPIDTGGSASAAASVKQAAKDMVQAEEQATASVTRTRKARSDSAKSVATAEKQAAREAASAVTAAEKEKQAAVTASERAMARAAAVEARFQAQQTRAAERRYYAMGPQLFEAKAREYAAANAASQAAASARQPLEITSGTLERAPGWVDGQNPFQAAANAAGGSTAAQNAEMRAASAASTAEATKQDAAGVAAAREKALAEAEINDRMLAQLGLKAQILAADKADAVSLQEQLFALRQYGDYRARGLTEAEAQARVDIDLLGLEEKRARLAAEQAVLVEKQMRAQSAAIASQFSGAGALTAGLVGGLGVAEISHLNDRYIELSNSLKVAGVSAAEFDAVQQHLLDTANKNGTNLNALADVFRSASLGAHDLGVSQSDLLKLTDAASNALRIQGVSASQAQGSLLQLGHAFESGRVNAREFNSLALNLYPILQAAAKGSDQFGGSVAKLRSEIVAGNVSSKVFFDAIIAGSGDLEERAGKATLTTAQGFTSLTNALVVYFGQADQAQGLSAALGTALQSLGANLDTLIPAIAAIGTALTVGYIARMTQAAIATQGFGAAILGAFGGPVGLAITSVTLAITGTVVAANDARAAAEQAADGLKALQDQYGEAGKGAVAAAGGIRGVASDALGAIPHVNAFAGAVGNLADQLYRQARAARSAQIEGLKSQLAESQKKEGDLAAQLPGGLKVAAGRARFGDVLGTASYLYGAGKNRLTNFLSDGYQDQDNAKAYRDQVGQSLLLQGQIAKLSDLKTNPISSGDLPDGATRSTLNPKDAKALANLQDKLAGLEKLVSSATGARLARINAQIDSTKRKISDIQAGASASAANAAESNGGRRGPSADTLRNRAEAARLKGLHEAESYNTELKQAHDKELQALADLSDSAAVRADLARQRVRDDEAEQAKNIRLKGPKDPKLNDGVAGTGERTADQTNTLLGINTQTADLHVQSIDKSERLRKATDAQSLDTANLDLRKEALQAQEDLTDSLAKRRVLADQIIDIEYQEKEAALKATLSPDSNATSTERKIAKAQLDALPEQKAHAQQSADQQNAGAWDTYVDKLPRTADSIGEAFQRAAVSGVGRLNDSLATTVTKMAGVHGAAAQILEDFIKIGIESAEANLFHAANSGSGGAGSGGSAGLFGWIGKLFGGGGSAGSGGGSGGGGTGSTGGGSGAPSLNSVPLPSFLADLSLPTLPGFATGGSGVIGGNAGVDRNVLSINNRPVARVGKGELLSISPTGISPNMRAAVPQISGPTIHQTIQYSGAVDIADKAYVQQMGAALYAHTERAVDQGGKRTLAATPAYTQRKDQLG